MPVDWHVVRKDGVHVKIQQLPSLILRASQLIRSVDGLDSGKDGVQLKFSDALV
jgi:hypothetical protein